MNTFTQSQKKIDNRHSTGHIICTICAIVMALVVLGSQFAKALDEKPQIKCEVKYATYSKQPLNIKVCNT